MLNDRKIIISVGNHRRSMNWQPQTLLLSELYARLSTPARSTETMQEYLALRKSEQDNLKDVGGYVAGALIGTRRKAGAVAGRDVVTLDLDTIPPRRHSGRSAARGGAGLRLLYIQHPQALARSAPSARAAPAGSHSDSGRIRTGCPQDGGTHRHGTGRPYHLRGDPAHVLAQLLRGWRIHIHI